jgi:hypothetical protein
MGLVSKQNEFSGMVAQLIIFAQQRGYQITFGDAYRDDRVIYGHKDSLHRKRLAVDLNLFEDGKYVSSDEAHAPLHDFWDSIGGAERIKGDGNHYSLEYNGMR